MSPERSNKYSPSPRSQTRAESIRCAPVRSDFLLGGKISGQKRSVAPNRDRTASRGHPQPRFLLIFEELTVGIVPHSFTNPPADCSAMPVRHGVSPKPRSELVISSCPAAQRPAVQRLVTFMVRSFSPTRSSVISISWSRKRRGNFSPHSMRRMLFSATRSSRPRVSSCRGVSTRYRSI